MTKLLLERNSTAVILECHTARSNVFDERFATQFDYENFKEADGIGYIATEVGDELQLPPLNFRGSFDLIR